jgi:tetratricopeptide (TPR) repeat protein
MATSIASAVQVRLTPDEMRRLDSRGEVNPDTYDAYLRAMYKIRRETGKGMREGIDLLTDAVENDPTSSLAWAGLAYGYGELGHSPFPEDGAYPRAKAAADRAMELDPDLAEAHLGVAMYQTYYEWDFDAAEKSFLRAIELNPNLSTAYYHLAWLMELLERGDEAIRYGEITKELDPLSPFFSGWLAAQYRYAGMHEKALEEAHTTLRIRKNYPVGHLVLGWLYMDEGRVDDAIAEHEHLRDNFYWSFAYAVTLARAGRTEEALEIAEALKDRNVSYVLGQLYAAAGEHDAAYKWMLKARDGKIPWYPWLLTWHFETESMRDDPRVVALAEELGL